VSRVKQVWEISVKDCDPILFVVIASRPYTKDGRRKCEHRVLVLQGGTLQRSKGSNAQRLRSGETCPFGEDLDEPWEKGTTMRRIA
jgi:hypothetical protein